VNTHNHRLQVAVESAVNQAQSSQNGCPRRNFRVSRCRRACAHRDVKDVLDLTEQDFQNISDGTGRLFEVGVHRSDGCLLSIVHAPTQSSSSRGSQRKALLIECFQCKGSV
jgi:hypothetical protein